MSKTNKKTQNNQLKGRNSNQKRKQTKNPNRPQQGKNGGSRKGQASVAAAYATGTLGSSPKVKSTRDHCNIIHREFLGNVSGSVLFTILLTLAINPGIAATFPWLSIQAQCWEQYRFKKLRFHYLTRTGSNTAGSVLMSPDYDASDAPPSNEVVQSTYEGTAEDAPWKDIILNLKTNLMSGTTQRKFVRNGALLPNQDIKLYDAATVYISTVDASAPAAWGKLWVEYDVDLFIPHLPPSGSNLLAAGGKIAGGGTMSAANPLGTSPVPDSDNSGILANNSSVISISRPGTYLVQVLGVGSAFTDITMTNITNAVITTLVAFAAGIGSKTFQVVTSDLAAVQLTFTATTVTSSTVYVALAPANSFV